MTGPRMDQRTRERLPVLPVLAASAAAGRDTAAARLAACMKAQPGEAFTAGGQELRRAVMAKGDTARTWAEDPADGRRRDLTLEEHRAFWAWAAIEVLRHAGVFSRGAKRTCEAFLCFSWSLPWLMFAASATGVVERLTRQLISSAGNIC